MNEQQQDWYRKGLGPRIDAIELALLGLAQKREDALPALRRLARTLRLSSQAYGFPAIAGAARAVEESTPEEARALGGELIAVLRREVAGHAPHVASVLIVSGDGGMAGDLAAALEARGKTVARVATAAEADRVLASRKIVFIVADMFLPDADGRQFIAALRSRPLTASIPVVALSAKLGEGADVPDLVPAVDGCFLKPAAPDQVAEFVALRMKRARETLRDARRDLLTGLLNRAAFYEQMEAARLKPQARGEPSVVALLKVDQLAALAEEYGAAVQEPLLRHVGALLSASFRAMDVVARWGAEEFAVLFPGEDLFGGLRPAARTSPPTTRSCRSRFRPAWPPCPRRPRPTKSWSGRPSNSTRRS